MRTHGDWAAWIHFFLSGVEEASCDALRQVRKLIDLREVLLLEGHGKDTKALVAQLFAGPSITIGEAAEVMCVSLPTTAKVLLALVERGYLREMTGRTRNRAFVAQAILDTFERTPA